ncbi:MAG: adenosylcobinamide-GDP ribazoletransferase [Synergistaceae bacterium]|nr:adenosylcobinamide-GDP ribazoletransferase [Synergistaceae bacterium]
MFHSLIVAFFIALTFLSIFPFPQKFFPEWNGKNLRFFCVMIPVTGVLFAAFWFLFSFALFKMENFSCTLRGFIMMFLTLALTGGLHMDGLMDTCDAIFSRRDLKTRLEILSDTHAGSFAVIGCVIILMAKTFLFAEIFSRGLEKNFLFLIPIYSRLGMALILNNLPFAKSDGLAVILGKNRRKRDNFFLGIFFAALIFFEKSIIIPAIFVSSLIIWSKICVKIFGGITGDLLGAFLEISEILLLFGTVIENCI